ncbi:TonB-dependent receptor domain-containing protein [Echinimonas agarilytica]|uniref:TonB-dependent receptor n=1 Tax=Echinimonas agarilytica TaxID=1215918 RepID=A0AA41W3H2_9GAMM|nr:TonB-dependent receptor [Echinimonas agarilytica]MCM2678102.1 TonB-dependent receptor [Echinimonas agarilytica]
MSLYSTSVISAEDTKQKDGGEEVAQSEAPEIITVTGVRSSLRDAAFAKKNADQIMDAISAEDIGQLPDNNIAEALQRVTGIQIGRDETGAGSSFQVRGLSQNRVEINGQSMASTGEDRSNSFNAVDSSLFKGIEVIKSPTADMVEGAIGATVRLKTFQPLDFKQATFNAAYQGMKNSIADDLGQKANFMGTTKWDMNDWGEIGVLLNVAYQERFTETHQLDSNWSPALEKQIENTELVNQAVFRPEDISIERKPFEEENFSFDSTIQWQLNESVELHVSGMSSKFERLSSNERLRFSTGNQRNTLQERDRLDTTNLDETPVILGAFERSPFDYEYVNTGTDESPVYEKQTDTVNRYIVQAGAFAPASGSTSSPVNTNFSSELQDIDQKTFGFGGKFDLSDDFIMEADYAYASSKTEKESFGILSDPSVSTAVEGNDDVEAISNSVVYFDYAPGQTFPELGMVSFDGGAAIDGALSNPDNYNFTRINGNQSTIENRKESISLDFDWFLDGDYITKLEFGVRGAKNDVSRERTELKFAEFHLHSIFSKNWRYADRNLNTGTMLGGTTNIKPSIDWINRVAAEDHAAGLYAQDITLAPGEGYLDPYVQNSVGLFPGSRGANSLPSWTSMRIPHNEFSNMVDTFFPGRQGDCLLFEVAFDNPTGLCKNKIEYPEGQEELISGGELDHVFTIPKAGLYTDQSYPYLIEETTRAVYAKFNFENELLEIPYSGNFGVRYVETDVDTLGMITTRISDGDAPYRDYDSQVQELYTATRESNTYSNVLPSGNVNFMFTDDMFVRLAFAKVMTRPNPGDLSPSLDLGNGFRGKEGTPSLKPEEATNYNLSWEWYISDVNSVSAAFFHMSLKNFLSKEFYTVIGPTDRDGNKQFDDPVTIEKPANGGSGSIDGIELAASHAFDYLPGALSGFGVQGNYTYTDSSQSSGYSELDGSQLPVPNLSENSFNFILFYDKFGFNFRAAYNYRDEYYEGPSNAGQDLVLYEPFDIGDEVDYSARGIQLPVWVDEFETLDISMSYKYKAATFFLQANNVLEEAQRKYVGDKEKTKHLLRFYKETGANYTAGVRVRF